jgi:hypothetical protein
MRVQRKFEELHELVISKSAHIPAQNSRTYSGTDSGTGSGIKFQHKFLYTLQHAFWYKFQT